MHGRSNVLAALVALSLSLGLAARSTLAQVPGGLNLTFTPSPSMAQVGQPVTFTYRASPPAVAPPFASITSVTIDFGDGQMAAGDTGGPGQTVNSTITHTYASAGAYTPMLSAEASNGGHSSTTASVTIQGGGAPQPSGQVVYGTGWNLIGVPNGTVLPPTEALFTWQAGDSSYETATTPQAGKGYWAFFPGEANALFLPQTSSSAPALRIPLPAGQWVMIGNPFSNNASVSGADAVFGYDPMSGYRSVSTLAPGLGAWAFSSGGGTAVITPALLR